MQTYEVRLESPAGSQAVNATVSAPPATVTVKPSAHAAMPKEDDR